MDSATIHEEAPSGQAEPMAPAKPNGAHPQGDSAPLWGDTAAAVDFFCAIVPAGRLAVAATVPDFAGISSAEIFEMPNGRESPFRWVNQRQGKANLYYTLNEPRPGCQGRLKESDIEWIRGIVIDIDPDKTEEALPGGYERERARLLIIAAKLRDWSFCTPAAIVDTGNGIQVLWLFPEPLPNTAENKIAVKAQARAIGRKFGSDAVHSLEHLFRIPGTINIPDAGKRQRRRVTTVSRVIHLDPGERCSLDNLRAIAEPVPEPAGPSTPAVDCSEAMDCLGAPENLAPELAATVARLRSEHPAFDRLLDTPAEVGGRSDHDFAIAARCVELGVADASDAACVVAAYSPDKTEEKGNSGMNYLASTVARALARVAEQRAKTEKVIADSYEAVDIPEPARLAAAPRSIDLNSWRAGRYTGEPAPQEWLIKGVLPKAIPGLVAASGGVGKSNLLLDLGCRIAFGPVEQPSPIFGGRVVTEGRVVILTAEDSLRTIHRRLSKLDPQDYRSTAIGERLMVIPLPDAGGVLPIIRQRRDALNLTDDYKRLREQLEGIADLALIAFDPLQAFAQAPINESPEAGQFLGSELASLASATGATTLITHHMSKVGKPIKNADEARDAIRGTSALVDAWRWTYALWPESDVQKAKAICKAVHTPFVNRRVINGAVVKTNDESDMATSVYVRNEFGLLVDRTAHAGVIPSDEILRHLLVSAVAEAAAAGQPFTKTGGNGIYKRKERLPAALQAVSRERLANLADDALSRDEILQCAAAGSSIAQYLDTRGGDFAEGRGHYKAGSAKKPFRGTSGTEPSDGNGNAK